MGPSHRCEHGLIVTTIETARKNKGKKQKVLHNVLFVLQYVYLLYFYSLQHCDAWGRGLSDTAKFSFGYTAPSMTAVFTSIYGSPHVSPQLLFSTPININGNELGLLRACGRVSLLVVNPVQALPMNVNRISSHTDCNWAMMFDMVEETISSAATCGS